MTAADAAVALRRLRMRLVAVDEISATSDLGRRKRSALEEIERLRGGDVARLEAARGILLEHELGRIAELLERV
jgi:hypothetical protein